MLSIIIPTLNEAPVIEATLTALQPLRRRGHEVILVDGGSDDGTPDKAVLLVDACLRAGPGRARQMNAGAARARHADLVFLHADTRLPDGADTAIEDALDRHGWGRFDVRIDSTHRLLAVVAFFINRRSRLTGIATGDQAIFVRRALFEAAGGYPDIALMEDIALSRRLRRTRRPACLRLKATTSGRRWERSGVLRTVLLMWRLRLAYYAGADPARLARRYGA